MIIYETNILKFVEKQLLLFINIKILFPFTYKKLLCRPFHPFLQTILFTTPV